MKKIGIILGCAVILVGMMAVPGMAKKSDECARIQDGTIEYGRVDDPSIEIIPIGYDLWGYNYQAHMFNGRYCDSDRVIGGDDCDVNLIMKWSNTWLSNKDCDGDNKLDRGYPIGDPPWTSSAAEGAWLTNHQRGSYIDLVSGKECKWTYFVKIVAAPADAYVDGGYWYTTDGILIGEVIWGAYAIVQQVENDPCAGLHGVQYLSPAGPGFGKWK